MEQRTIYYLNNQEIYSHFKEAIGTTPNITNTTSFELNEKGVGIIKFNTFKDIDLITQGFSTRLGGVSEGIYKSMNLGFTLDDSPQNVSANFALIAETLGTDVKNMVYSKQTHTTNVLAVNEANAGMGIITERNFDNIDGLVTNSPKLCLVTAYADCIPVIVVDTKNRCIGAAHSGWRGTVGNITKNMLELMHTNYGTDYNDIVAFVGPGICADCYEVSADVAEQFKKSYNYEVAKDITPYDLIVTNGAACDKFQLNLPMANVFNLYDCGVSLTNIYVSDICTCCNPDLLFSHRATGGKRGVLCNFIYIN